MHMFSKFLINLIKCLLRPKIEHSWRYCGWRHRRWSVLYSSQDINQIKDFGSFYCNFFTTKHYTDSMQINYNPKKGIMNKL